MRTRSRSEDGGGRGDTGLLSCPMSVLQAGLRESPDLPVRQTAAAGEMSAVQVQQWIRDKAAHRTAAVVLGSGLLLCL